MKLKLTPVQLFRIHEINRHAHAVLAEVKRKPLKGKALEDMKTIESCAIFSETIILSQQV